MKPIHHSVFEAVEAAAKLKEQVEAVSFALSQAKAEYNAAKNALNAAVNQHNPEILAMLPNGQQSKKIPVSPTCALSLARKETVTPPANAVAEFPFDDEFAYLANSHLGEMGLTFADVKEYIKLNLSLDKAGLNKFCKDSKQLGLEFTSQQIMESLGFRTTYSEVTIEGIE